MVSAEFDSVSVVSERRGVLGRDIPVIPGDSSAVVEEDADIEVKRVGVGDELGLCLNRRFAFALKCDGRSGRAWLTRVAGVLGLGEA